MVKWKSFSLFCKVLLGTLVLSKGAAAGSAVTPGALTDWSSARRDLQNEIDHSEGIRLLAMKTATQLSAGAPLNDTILASYLAARETEFSKLDAFWLDHELVRVNPKAMEDFLKLRSGLTAQRAILSGPKSSSWKDYLTLAYD
ncbi:MAG: hypothetical protein AAGA08_07980 [Pseudomonadota bacterium]